MAVSAGDLLWTPPTDTRARSQIPNASRTVRGAPSANARSQRGAKSLRLRLR
jgi:hypothetical protein